MPLAQTSWWYKSMQTYYQHNKLENEIFLMEF